MCGTGGHFDKFGDKGQMDIDFEILVFSAHAIKRMFEREITEEDVRDILQTGEIIAEYPDDPPYPSFLVLGFLRNNPLHVVFAHDRETKTGIVVTVYRPAPDLWGDGFRSRREQS
ncbi:MAG: DUF4258 domain-containing protein [Candidatus Brocadiia bacterium]